jgi:hypothetical protein
LRQDGYSVESPQLLLGYILPAKAVSGSKVSINGDPFMVMKFQDEDSAQEHVDERPHRVRAAGVVLRSDPERQYRLPLPAGTVDLPDHLIEWSSLPSDAKFQQALNAAVRT